MKNTQAYRIVNISDFARIEKEFAKFGADFNEVLEWYADSHPKNKITSFNSIIRALYLWVLHRSKQMYSLEIIDYIIEEDINDCGLFVWQEQKLYRVNSFFDIEQLFNN